VVDERPRRGAAPLIAAEIGRRRHAVREVRRTFRMGAWLSVASGAGVMLVLTQGEPLMLLSGQAPWLARGAGDFLRILMWTAIPLLLSGHLRNTVSALGRPALPTVIAGLAVGSTRSATTRSSSGISACRRWA
jgi:MATE family multidrug resistance protein